MADAQGGYARWHHGRLVTYPRMDGWWIAGFAEDQNGTIWMGASSLTAGRLCSIRDSGTECYGADGRFGAAVMSPVVDRDGNLWVPTTNAVWRWQPGSPQRYPMPDAVALTLHPLTDTPTGEILIATKTGICQIAAGKVTQYWIPPPPLKWPPNNLHTDSHGGVWMYTLQAGLLHLQHGLLDQFGTSDGLSGAQPTAWLEDREGNIWLATDGGLDRFRALAAINFSEKQGIIGPAASVLADRNGTIWLSTYAGLYRWRDNYLAVYRAATGQLRRDPEVASRPLPEVIVKGLPQSWATLFQDHRGAIWLGTPSALGYITGSRFVSIAQVPSGYIDSITEDSNKALWIAHRAAGLMEVFEDHVVRQIPWTSASDRGPALRITADPTDGGLWLGFLAGGIVHLVDGKPTASFGAREGLAPGPVNELRVSENGTVWVATEGGLSRVRTGHIDTLSTTGGLPCANVDATAEDGTSLWVYTACGLVRVALSDLESWTAGAHRVSDRHSIPMVVLDSSEGVRPFYSNSTFSPHMAKAADGKLWLSTPVNVFTQIDPRNIAYNKLPPPVHVENVVADRTRYSEAAVLHLPPLTRDLTIEYTALSLIAPEKIQFRYKLEGHDRDWQDAGTRRQAYYTDLPPGTYRFRVIASNNSGVWNTQGASVDFSIAPAYWQTTWFRALCVAAVVAFLALLYWLRIRQVAHRFDLLVDARVGERMRIARELHDTLLQSFNAALVRFRTVQKLLATRPDEARQTLDSAIEDARAAIVEGRQSVQGLRSSVIETNDLSEALRALAHELASESDR
ncbi:MAG: hypothetical protein JO299_15900, partial [Gammaproteobacteria bacterium]|nr:hypothetical protein [Gammaproteobacteria bacterium]